MLFSQSENPYAANIEKLKLLIDERLEQPGGDTASAYILKEIRSNCGNEYICQRDHIREVLSYLWHKGAFPAGVPIAKEEERLAERYGDLEDLIHANEGLSGFYYWLNRMDKVYYYLEKLVVLYEKAGMHHKVIEKKFHILDAKVWRLEDREALRGLFKLLDESIELGHELTTARIREKLLEIGVNMDSTEMVREQVEALENLVLADPIIHDEYTIAHVRAIGRANLLLKEGKLKEAKTYYQKALDIVRQFKDTGREVAILHTLARLEWESQNAARAKVYLDTAFIYADRLNYRSYLADNYELKTEIAAAEKRFEDAYRYLRLQNIHKAAQDSSSARFNPSIYYLDLEKRQLDAETEKQALELKLSKNRFLTMIVIVSLVILLALGLLVGLQKQRQGKRKIAEQYSVIQQQAEQLKQLDAAKSRFFANVSHELRTPLSLIAGPIRTLQKGNTSPEKQEKLLAMANRGTKDLRHLVDEILDLGKMEAGKMTVSLEATLVASFFQRYFSQFESLADRNGIDYRFHIEIGKEVVVQLDREKCRQIIFNLLSNAFKFTPAGGQVRADLQLKDGQLRLAVADTGKGIHPDDLPHVFDRYFQSNRPDATASGGTGIGLAICQEYARLLGGSIAVQSTLGEGTRFAVSLPVETVTLPLDDEPLAPQPEEIGRVGDDAVLPSTAGKEKSPRPLLLVVEDTPDLQDYIRTILEDRYEVVTARNGREALDLLLGEKNNLPLPVDLVISDLMMPEMDGYQLLTSLKSNEATRSIPVIMLTARADRDDRLRALRIGVDDYLTKPFDEEELMVRIQNLLNNQTVRKATAAEEPPETDAPEVSQAEQEWLENFETYVQDNFANDALTISFLAQEFAMSESTLLRQVTRLTGLSPKQYLQEVRLDAARQLLENRAYRTVARVAVAAGFSNAGTFTRNFSKRFGKSPVEYLND